MFDRIVIGGGESRTVHQHTQVTVQEHRAPTDDSIRLYKEMEEKAYGNILRSIELRDNGLHVNAIVVAPQDGLTAWKCLYRMTLNGRNIEGELKFKYHELRTATPHEIAEKLVEQASRHIACELLQGLPELPR